MFLESDSKIVSFFIFLKIRSTRHGNGSGCFHCPRRRDVCRIVQLHDIFVGSGAMGLKLD